MPRIWLLITLTTLLFAGCGGTQPYLDTFDVPGSWRSGDDFEVSGSVADGVYRFEVEADVGTFWTTAGLNFGDGFYSVEATQRAGSLDAGYGMMLRVDDQNDSFYLFEISGDGFVWIGRCLAGCVEQSVLVDDWWFGSEAVRQGLDETNVLKVEANGANLTFFVNDIEVGRVTDPVLRAGDVGLFVETLGFGDIVIEFDNFRVAPLDG